MPTLEEELSEAEKELQRLDFSCKKDYGKHPYTRQGYRIIADQHKKIAEIADELGDTKKAKSAYSEAYFCYIQGGAKNFADSFVKELKPDYAIEAYMRCLLWDEAIEVAEREGQEDRARELRLRAIDIYRNTSCLGGKCNTVARYSEELGNHRDAIHFYFRDDDEKNAIRVAEELARPEDAIRIFLEEGYHKRAMRLAEKLGEAELAEEIKKMYVEFDTRRSDELIDLLEIRGWFDHFGSMAKRTIKGIRLCKRDLGQIHDLLARHRDSPGVISRIAGYMGIDDKIRALEPIIIEAYKEKGVLPFQRSDFSGSL